ncbi:MAG: zinc ribbon domain-containing protein [Candidatus Heimdallarchaeota archaeon]
MRKNKILFVLLFITFAGLGITIFAQQGECVLNFETTLSYGEGWFNNHNFRISDPSQIFYSSLKWSFVGDNADVGITVRWGGDILAMTNESGSPLAIGVSQASGKEIIYGQESIISFWHMDDTVIGETTTLSIKLTYTPFYFGTYMILIYIGSVLLIAIITVSIVVPVRKRKKKKALQETSLSSSFTPTTSQPDSPPNDLPPPPPPDYSEGTKIFCWKCGQPNTSQTSYCIKCGSDIHNPER